MCKNMFSAPKADMLPARQADPTKATESVVKSNTVDESTTDGNGTSIKRTKQKDRVGVPGLNL